MTTFYVSFAHGLDANNGLGPDASHATNKPWKTLAKALGAAGIASGDRVEVAPGTQREVVTVAMTSPTVETVIHGDVENASGFKDASGVLLAGGSVICTAYTTDDISAPATTAVLDLNGRDFLTFERLRLVGGNTTNSVVRGATAHSVNITLRECVISVAPNSTAATCVFYTGLANVASNWLLERCILQANTAAAALSLNLPTSVTADYDVNFQARNCLILSGHSGTAITVSPNGGGAFKAGGVDVVHCTLWGGLTGLLCNGANLSTSIPCTIEGSIVANMSTALSATTLGQLVEDKNYLAAGIVRTNVTAGASSQVTPTHALLLELDAWISQGRQPRPFFAPMAGSPQLGFGTPAGAPTVDLANRPRPAGGGSTLYAVGALERHDTAAREITIVDAGGVGIKLIGPADQDLLVPVDATPTILSVKVRYDSTHGTTNKPQALLLANGEIGVAAQTLTAAVGVDTWEVLTFASFTPSAAGGVTVRLVSRAAAGGGIAYFDTADVA